MSGGGSEKKEVTLARTLAIVIVVEWRQRSRFVASHKFPWPSYSNGIKNSTVRQFCALSVLCRRLGDDEEDDEDNMNM